MNDKSLSLVIALALFAGACGDDRPGTMGDPDAGPIAVDAGADEDAGDVTPTCMAPSPPYGTAVGRVLEPFTLNTCDDEPFDFYDEEFCSEDTKLTVISIAAEWCRPCILESQQLTAEITEPYRPRGVRVIQILVQTETYGPPTRTNCQSWVDRFGLTNTELYDPGMITSIYFPDNSLPSTIIVDATGTIRFRENGVMEGLVSLKRRLDELLAE